MADKYIIVVAFGLLVSLMIIYKIMKIIINDNHTENKKEGISNVITKVISTENIITNILNIYLKNKIGRIKNHFNKSNPSPHIESNNEEQDLLSNYKSLAPTEEAENFAIYDKIITKVLEEEYEKSKKKKNKNIAITCIYSGGKSSMIKTYFANHLNIKYLLISLGKYESKEEGKQNEEDIEYNLLQQIIFHKKPNEVRFSEINRIDYDRNYVFMRSIWLSVVFVTIVTFFLILKNFDYIICFTKRVNTPTFGIVSTLAIVLLVLIFIMMRGLIMKIYAKFRNLKIKFRGKIDIEPESSSVLRKSIGELINFFKQTDYSIVVFEDLDRLDKPIELFTKIKELNMILNNSINNKEIQFIYEINDSIFDSSEHRTKFFDAIIPIVSYTNSEESSLKLQEYFSEISGTALSMSDFSFVGAYADNSRIVADIYNEFLVYYNSNISYINDRKNFKDLFYLISYKVLFPKKFDALLQKESILAYYLTDEFQNAVLSKYKKDKIEELENQKKNIIEEDTNRFKTKVNEVIDNIKLLPNPARNDLLFVDIDEPILNFDDLVANPHLVFKLNVDGLKLIMLDEDGEIINTLDKERIFKNISIDSYFEELKQVKNNEHIEKIEEEIKRINNSFRYNNIEKGYIIDYLKKNKIDDYTEKTNENYILNSFEEELIEKEHIDPYYKTLLTVQKDSNKEDIATKLIIKDLLLGKNRIYDLKLKNPEIYVDMHKDEFNRDSFCMKDFYKIIFSKKNTDIIASIFNNLTFHKLRYIMRMENDGVKILTHSREYFNKIWEILGYSDEIENELCSFYIAKTIYYANSNELDKNINFKNCVNNIHGIEKIISDNYEALADKLKNYNFDFKQKYFDTTCKSFFNFVYETELNDNLALFKATVKSLEIYIDEKKELTSYIEMKEKYPKLYEYAMKHIYALILRIEKIQEDKEEIIVSLVNDNYISSQNSFKALLGKEKNSIKDISKVGNEYYQTILDCNKMDYNFNNLATLHFNKDVINDYDARIIDIVNSNCNVLVDTSYSKELNSVIKYIIYTLDINLESFKSLSDYFFKEGKYHLADIPTISTEKLEYLIDNKYMKTKIIDNLITIDENNDLKEDSKVNYIENSFALYKEEVFDTMTESILEKLSKTKVNSQNKLDYLLKYKDKFGDKIYELIGENIDFENCELESVDLLRITNKFIGDVEKVNDNDLKTVIKTIEKNINKMTSEEIKTELSRIDESFKKIYINNGLPKYLNKKCYSSNFLDQLKDFCLIDNYTSHSDKTFQINRKKK